MRLFLILLLLAASPLALPAAILEYNLEFDQPVVQDYGDSLWALFQPIGGIPALNGSLAPGDQLKITYSAKPGYLFSIVRPQAYAFVEIRPELWTVPVLVNPVQFPASSFQLVGLSGPDPQQILTEFNHLNGELVARALVKADTIQFKSIVMTFTMDGIYSRTFNNVAPNKAQMYAQLVGAANDPSIDNFQFASLIPDSRSQVPEPSTFAMLASAMGLLAWARRNRSNS